MDGWIHIKQCNSYNNKNNKNSILEWFLKDYVIQKIQKIMQNIHGALRHGDYIWTYVKIENSSVKL